MQKNIKRSGRRINVICALLVACLVCTGAAYDVTGLDLTITEIDEIRDVENTFNIKTRENTLSEILSSTGLEPGLYDKVNFDEYHTFENGDKIVIRRGVRITVEIDGAIVTTSSTCDTVGEALIENGIFIGELDYTEPALDTPINEELVIKVVRVGSDTIVREETIPFDTVYKDDSSLYVGQTKVLKKGIEGKIVITENVVTENGVETARHEISRETLTEKVDKVVAKGTKKKPQAKTTQKAVTASKQINSAQISDKGFSYSKKLTMTATAYSAFKKDGSYGITASGMTARHGIVAVDPKVIPLGTKLYVDGYGYAVAGDTGGVIKGNKIDLCFEKPNKELMVFGRKKLDVYILN